jgi:hypothetical protein
MRVYQFRHVGTVTAQLSLTAEAEIISGLSVFR